MEALKKISIDLMNEWRPRRVYDLAATHPTTALLSSLSLVTFMVIPSNYLIQMLSFLFYYLDVLARVMCGWLYPAALVAAMTMLCMHVFSLQTDRFDVPQRYPFVAVMLRVALCILAGQLTLLGLPPVVNFFAMPFASAPILLFTVVFAVGMMGYGLYLVLRQTLQERGQPLLIARNVNDGADLLMDVDGDNNACVVCMVNPKTHLIKPCNHFCVCEDCIRLLNTCPLCQRPINMHERIYST